MPEPEQTALPGTVPPDYTFPTSSRHVSVAALAQSQRVLPVEDAGRLTFYFPLSPDYNVAIASGLTPPLSAKAVVEASRTIAELIGAFKARQKGRSSS